MSYREPLPEGCPPPESIEIREDRVVFRLASAFRPVPADFDSQRRLHPDRVFAGVGECQVCGVSVFGERADCVMAQKLPALRAKLVCRLRLGVGAGRIKQTGKPSHHTWWPLADFDILGHCEQEVA